MPSAQAGPPHPDIGKFQAGCLPEFDGDSTVKKCDYLFAFVNTHDFSDAS
jgi:hypothetical protein